MTTVIAMVLYIFLALSIVSSLAALYRIAVKIKNSSEIALVYAKKETLLAAPERQNQDEPEVRTFPNQKEALAVIESIAKTASQIDLLVIAGTHFLVPEPRILKTLRDMSELRKTMAVRILLLDPRSRYAVDRSLLEEGVISLQRPKPNDTDLKEFDYPSAKLCREIRNSLKVLEDVLTRSDELRKNAPSGSGFKLEVRTYNAFPNLMYVRLDDSIFSEPYHNGMPKHLYDPVEKYLGKAAPIIETTIATAWGERLSSHYEHLWNHSETRRLKRGCVAALDKALRDGEWVRSAVESFAAEEKQLRMPTPS